MNAQALGWDIHRKFSQVSLDGKAGRAFLERLALPPASRTALLGYLELLDRLTALLVQVEAWMQDNLEVDEIVRLLRTIPGIGLILAHVIRAEIGEIERFPSRRHRHPCVALSSTRDNKHTNDKEARSRPLTGEGVSGIGWVDGHRRAAVVGEPHHDLRRNWWGSRRSTRPTICFRSERSTGFQDDTHRAKELAYNRHNRCILPWAVCYPLVLAQPDMPGM